MFCESTIFRNNRAPRVARRLVFAGFATLVTLLAPGSAAAQHEEHQSTGAIGWAPRELLERPLPLRDGVGKLHEEVTTKSSEAQAYYDQGLAYLHSFVWIEAARSFHQALRLDPSLAMAYIGLSDAYVGLLDFPSAAAQLEKAEALAEKTSERERTRIHLRSLQVAYLQDSGDIKKYFAYRQALTDALSADVNDPWLWILRGFADEGTPTAHGQGGAVDTIAFYQTALRLAPDNLAAHHYLAHTLENHGAPEDALRETEIYVRLAPAIPHAHHMHGHELRRLGQTEEAIAEFLKAEELEDNYYRAERVPPQLDWHHAHNLQLLAMSYEAIGQLKPAENAFKRAFALPTYTDFADYNRKAWPEFLLDHGRPDEALQAANVLVNSQWPMARFVGHTLAGRAELAKGNVSEAKNELELAERETEQIHAAVLKSLNDSVLLRAEILFREQKQQEAEQLMDRMMKDVLAVAGPDAWSEALFQIEYIGRVARAAGDWELAERAGRETVRHDPSYAGGYLALALVEEHRGDNQTAKQELAKAESRWGKADTPLRATEVQRP